MEHQPGPWMILWLLRLWKTCDNQKKKKQQQLYNTATALVVKTRTNNVYSVTVSLNGYNSF